MSKLKPYHQLTRTYPNLTANRELGQAKNEGYVCLYVCMFVCVSLSCFSSSLVAAFVFFVQIVQPRKLFTWGVSVCLSVSGVSLGLLVMGICSTPIELSLAQLHKWFLEVQDPPIIRANLRQMVFGSKRSCNSSCKSAPNSLQKKKSNFIIEPKTAAHLGSTFKNSYM